MTSPRYAADTSVSAARSREEIEKILARYGASEFAYGWSGERAMLSFVADGRQVRFTLPLPDRNDRAFTHSPTGRTRTKTAAEESYDQAVRQRWRALALVIKAKLEAIASGITGFDQEFLAHIVVGEQTVGEHLIPRLEAAIADHQPLALLPGGR